MDIHVALGIFHIDYIDKNIIISEFYNDGLENECINRTKFKYPRA